MSYIRDKGKSNSQKKINNFVDNARKTLFDIAACKWKDFNNFNCENQNKVPKREHAFLLDQRTTRVDYIRHLDAEYTSNVQKSIERKKRRSQKRMNEIFEQLSKNIALYENVSSKDESIELIENTVSFSVESAYYKPINIFPNL